jgi:DNA polymerase-3 subunit gamma/tau
MLFYGPAGSGKSSLAFVFARALYCQNFSDDVCGECKDCKMLKNPSLATGIWGLPEIIDCTKLTKSDLERKLYELGFKTPWRNKEVVIFDEFHRVTWRLQDELLMPLENLNNILLIFCLIDLKKVDEPLRQRSKIILQTARPEIKELVPWLKKICDAEGIVVKEPEGLRQIAIESDKLPRECLSTVETLSYLHEPITIDLVKEVAKTRRGIDVRKGTPNED